MEPRQCTASVLEALMGFDEQQSQFHAPRHSKVLSEGYLQRVASIGISKKKSPSRCHPFRMKIEEPLEFFSSLKVEHEFSRCKNREKGDSVLSAAYLPLTRHHFMNEKDFLIDKVMQTPKDLQDLPEVIDFMDIFPRPTREKNYIPNNHVKNESSVSKSHYTLTEGSNDVGTKFKDSRQGQAHSSVDLDLSKSSEPFLERSEKSYFSSLPTSLKGSDLVDGKCRDFHSLLNGKHIAEEKERTMEHALHPIKLPSEVSNMMDGSRRKTRHDFVNSHLKKSRSEPIYDNLSRKETEYERTLPSDSSCKPVKYDFQHHVCSNEEHLHSGSPLCLSCKDKRIEQLSKNSHRSITRSRYEALRKTWFLKPEGHGNWLQCKPLNRSSNKKHTSEPTLKLNSKIFPCPDSESDHVASDGCMVGDDLKTRVEKKGLCDQHLVNRENPAIERSLKSDYQGDNFSGTTSTVLDVQTDDLDIPTVNNQEPDSLSCILSEVDGDSSTNSCRATCTSTQQEGFASEHCPNKELNSIANLEEAFQPSPVSVLEPLFIEETLSNSESSGINGRDLMMQLELLMSDSPGANSEEHDLFVSSDDGVEGSRCSYDGIDDLLRTFKFNDSRDFSYLVDVLSEAGLHCRNLEKGCASWHAQEPHVIRPSVFETLEKKYGEQDTWRRSERKLLFDRINSGLVELFQSFVGVPEWAKPVSRRFRPLLDQETIEEELWILLDSQEKEVNKDLVDKQFGKEIGWMELGNEIDFICREVERLLINELVAEFNSKEFF